MNNSIYAIDGTQRDIANDSDKLLLLYGNLSKAHDFHTGVEGSFSKAIKQAHILLTKNKLLGAITPLTRSNRHILTSIAGLLYKLKIKNWLILPVDISKTTKQHALISARFSVSASNIKSAISYAKKLRINARPANFPLCTLKYDINEDNLLLGIKITNNVAIQPLTFEPKNLNNKCKECSLKDICPMFQREYIEMFSDEEIIAIK